VSGTSCASLEDHRELWKARICLSPVSKDCSGDLQLIDSELQECNVQRCQTFKTEHLLTVDLVRNNRDELSRCDSNLAEGLNGRLVVCPLITALIDDGENRGPHTGDFVWQGASARVEGVLSGMTNVGTHRGQPFDPACQDCFQPGFMEGRLCGQIVRPTDERLAGCAVTAAYRLVFDATKGFGDSGISGTLEGVVVCPCEAQHA
jgi:hypothetical protein